MTDLCPCMQGEPFDNCCGPLLSGEKSAATAAQLMRSRYTAFARGDRDYLIRSWHRSTRPKPLRLDPDQRWLRLEIVGTTGGGLLEAEGTVEFRAHYEQNGRRDVLHQNSNFVKQDGRWVYLE
ncbi:YchJ family protein [Antrihabitans cavernicola]|uniref:YchJ-like middle NTF2-like domain-containing protein n=1 Tax=Antrihabitans cavernicola TaxID=2495913 RepID=A0A5A7SAK7_9NOCA|nr:YchJ family metal-binding protein [Spelaeibacter cavernicola]KAA0022956.1 hypothetical protein FOY51_10645 [Spelaeibacter cavernicola]